MGKEAGWGAWIARKPHTTEDTTPRLLDLIGCRDIESAILDKCGVLCLMRLVATSKSTRTIINQYNQRTKRIFPVRCGGFDHEYHTFWTTYERERAAENDTTNQPCPPPTLNGGDTNSSRSSTLSPISDLWGPVVTDKQEDEFYQRCEIRSNNTGELTGILQALLWARQHGGQEPFALCYDSMYAANITSSL